MSVNRIPPEDLLALSAYLDGALPAPERVVLEQRLAVEPILRAELESLRETVALLKSLPRLKAPRDFSLTPAMLGQTSKSSGGGAAPSPKIISVTRFNRWQLASAASLAASIMLVFIGLFSGFNASENETSSEAQGSMLGQTEDVIVFGDTAAPETTPALSLTQAQIFSTETQMATSRQPDQPILPATQMAGMVATSPAGEEAPGGPPPAPMSEDTGTGSNNPSGASQDEQAETSEAEDAGLDTFAAPTDQVSEAEPESVTGAVPPPANAGGAAQSTPQPTLLGYVAATASQPAFTPTVMPTRTSSATMTPMLQQEAVVIPASEEGDAQRDEADIEKSGDDESDSDGDGFEVTPLLIIGLIGAIVSASAMTYNTWRKR